MVRRAPIGVALLAVALAIAACGDTEEESTATTDPPETSTDTSDTAVEVAPADPTTTAATATSTVATVPPTTIATSTTGVEPPQPDPGCERLTDFEDDDGGWIIVNDGVMGGRSEGSVAFGAGTMRFTGTVVTAGGGFTSVRHPLDGELADSGRVKLRVRSDERTYAVTMESDAEIGGRSVSYGADLPADVEADGDGWQVATVSYADLEPTIFGSPVDAPPFDADAATEIGIIIADDVDGPFALDADWIDACG